MALQVRPDVEFAVLSGGPPRSNNNKYLERANQMAADGKLTIMADLKKNDYYNVVNDSKVLFNCALQDWVSNTVSEADALGCNVVYPAYRSPETFANDYTRLYTPWSKDSAVEKILKGFFFFFFLHQVIRWDKSQTGIMELLT